MEKYSCSLPSFFRKVERKNMAANYAKIRDGGKGVGLHYRAFEGFSRVVALNLRQLRREDFQIATQIREVGVVPHRYIGAYREAEEVLDIKHDRLCESNRGACRRSLVGSKLHAISVAA